tara:strand:- start:532 stop:1176 length:645 start_codon:yes stop_codon:yes gene_type:complete
MKYNFRYLLKSIISFLILIFGIYYIYINFINETRTLSFNNKNLSSNFEINIYNNIKNIKNYLNNYEFIQSYIIKKKNSKVLIDINLKKPFAKNIINREIIFNDGTVASYDFFDQSYIESIFLIDTSIESLKINNYLKTMFDDLKRIFNINQIEFIDQRRYNLIIDNNIKVMLPKKIDQKLIMFIEKNLELLKNKGNFNEYIDFRNFNEKTIRLK